MGLLIDPLLGGPTVRHLGAKAGSRHLAGIRLLGPMRAGFKGVDTSGLFFVYTPPSSTSLRPKVHLIFVEPFSLQSTGVLAISQPCTSRSNCLFLCTSRPPRAGTTFLSPQQHPDKRATNFAPKPKSQTSYQCFAGSWSPNFRSLFSPLERRHCNPITLPPYFL